MNMNESALNPGWYRFRLGSFTVTVISDGPMPLKPPSSGFDQAPEKEIEALLEKNFLPKDQLLLGMNALIVDTGTQVVLFDTGMGHSMGELSRMFGPSTGHLLTSLRAAGFSPEDIDVVAVTHAHPDHCWGLVDESGVPVFPNAQVAIAKEELDYWLNESNRSVSFFADASVSGAIKNITPYLDKLILAHDGEQVVPGISALLCAGHSPGHMAYLIESGDSALVTTGDLAHHHILSLEHPEWRISYDTDPEHAVRSRRQLFDRLAAERILTHGYHFPWPGLGHVVKEDDRYRWIAAPSYTYIF